jgi:NADPH:quinone reductase-like Zn-dependent oxidoreductase
VQLARWRGATVIGTASTANVAAARELGADQVIDVSQANFEELIEQVDLVFDTVGGERLAHSLAVLGRSGRLVSVAAEPSKQAAATQGIEAVYFVVEPCREQLAKVGRLVEDGRLRVSVAEAFPLTEARAAFRRVQQLHRPGKIVLRVADDAPTTPGPARIRGAG